MAALSCKKHCRTEMTQESCKGRLFTNRELWRLMCPLVIELLLTLLVGMIDSIMVSSVGEAAVSGVSLVDTVMQLLIYLFAALGTGGAVVAGQYLGSGNQKDACKSSEQLIGFSAVFSLAVMVVLIILKDIILNRLFGEITPEVRKYADTYLTITAFSIPAIAVYEAGAATFRAMSNSKITMWISLMMNMINVTGNAIFIYGAGMATGGAAVSTLLSRVAAAVVVTILLFNEQQELHIRKTLKIQLDRKFIGKILYIGIPNGVENGMFQLGKILVLGLVSAFGTGAIAANAIATNLSAIQVIPGSAIALGITTVISRCIGKGDYEQAKYYNRLLIKATYVALLVIDLSIYFALPLLLPIYNLSQETASLTTQMLLIHTLAAVCIWPLTFDLPASMRAAGDVKFAMIVSIASMWVFRIGAAYLLANGLRMGAVGVWAAMAVDWLFRAVVFSLRWLGGKWKLKRII